MIINDQHYLNLQKMLMLMLWLVIVNITKKLMINNEL